MIIRHSIQGPAQYWCFITVACIAVNLAPPAYAQQPSVAEDEPIAEIPLSPRWHYAQSSIEKHRTRGQPSPSKKPPTTPQNTASNAIVLSATTSANTLNNYLGKVVWVDPAQQTAVGYLESRFFNIEEDVHTRNQAFEITATLSPTPTQRGRAYGFDILSGSPNEGDEIIHPGSMASRDTADGSTIESSTAESRQRTVNRGR